MRNVNFGPWCTVDQQYRLNESFQSPLILQVMRMGEAELCLGKGHLNTANRFWMVNRFESLLVSSEAETRRNDFAQCVD